MNMAARICMGWMAAGLACLALACGDAYRPEPLLLEGYVQVTPEWVQEQTGEDEEVAQARATVDRFLKAVEGEECGRAWEMLSLRYRDAFVKAAGGADAAGLFCQGNRVAGDAVVKCDWRQVLLGPDPYYLSSVPPEAGFPVEAGQELYFSVQRNGGYTAFVLVHEKGGPHLEPFL
jgi:hypothetical protein